MGNADKIAEIKSIEEFWKNDRWNGLKRPYTAESVWKLRTGRRIEWCRALDTSQKLWQLFQDKPFIRTFGALTGNQAVQMVQAGAETIYMSGWQTAADANLDGETFPDMSLYGVESGPRNVLRFNQALERAAQVQRLTGRINIKDWFVPIVADAEAGFGGNLNTKQLVENYIKAGAAAIHLEDQRAAVKKCGHLGGKVVVPIGEFIERLVAARAIADIMGVPLVIIARTDAEKAGAITNDWDERDRPFISGKMKPCAACHADTIHENVRTIDGQYYMFQGGTEACIARGLAYAPYADLLWMETENPDLEQAKKFANAIHAQYPGKFLAYNCSPSFNWSRYFMEKHKTNGAATDAIRRFQDELGELSYKFQFITLASFHLINYYTFMFAREYLQDGMLAFNKLQMAEFEARDQCGYQAAEHQKFVGTEWFDEFSKVVTGGKTVTLAMEGSTEEKQFKTRRQS